MNFKNINNLFLLVSIIFLFSCQPIGNITKKISDKSLKNKSLKVNLKENKELISKIDTLIVDYNNDNNFDYYRPLIIKKSITKNKFTKLYSINSFEKKYEYSNSLLPIIYNDSIFMLNYKSELKIYDLYNYGLIKTISLNIKKNNDLSYPTSFAKYKNNFFATYSDGNMINFDINGQIVWNIYLNDIIKTPIKIFNNNIILLTSNKIISIDPHTGHDNWSFLYEGDNILQVKGGLIKNFNQSLFFILPNNKFGIVDTLFLEKNDIITSYFDLEDSIDNSKDIIHSYKNFISYFDDNKYLTTFNFFENKLILNRKIFPNISSSIFFNNALFTLNNNRILKSYNVKNQNLFWQVDISSFVKKEDNIVSITSYLENLIIIFKDGVLLEINSMTGEIISNQILKIKQIDRIFSYENFIFINQLNGKTVILSQ